MSMDMALLSFAPWCRKTARRALKPAQLYFFRNASTMGMTCAS